MGKREDLTSEGSELQSKAFTAKWPEGQQSFSNPVMVSIITPPGMVKQRAPVDVVLVLHVHIRFMAPENWHNLLIQATDFVISKLDVHDRLAIVPASLMKAKDASTNQETKIDLMKAKDASTNQETKIDSMKAKDASTNQESKKDDANAISIRLPIKPKLLKMTSENKRETSDAVKGSQAMRRNAPLTKDLELAESALYATESDEKVDRAGYIIVISNSNEDLSSMITWRFRSVHAFGFQDAHNARTMCTIASNSESTYAIFDEGGHITQAFDASMDRITSAVEPLEVKLKCEQDVVLSAISAPRISYFISYDKKVGIIWANANLTSEAVTNFIVYLDVPKLRWTNPASGSLLNVEVMYSHDPNLNKFKTKPLIIACKGSKESQVVDAEKVRMEAVKIVADIIAQDKSDSEQHHKAAETLQNRWTELLKDSREAVEEGLVSRLAAEIHEMETRLHNNYLWLEYMLSWRSHQWWPLPPLTMDKKQDSANDPLLKLRILAKVDGIQEPIGKNHGCLPVLVQVTAPVEGLAKVKRTPLDLVAVLDVGCGSRAMKKKRLQLLNKAMEFIMTKLTRNDRLAIVPVKSTVTRPAEGLFRRKKKLRSEDAKLLHVVTSTTKHVQQILDDRGEHDKHRMGLIILISGTNDTLIPEETPRCRYTVHAFGFRDAGNARTMYDIARVNHGIYAVIDDHQDRITEAFMACFNNITSTIALNTKVNIVCSHSSDMKLFAIESGQFTSSIDNEKKIGSIFAGALYASAVKRFVVYLENIGEEDYGGLSNLLAVDVTWQQITVASGNTEEATHGQVQIVRDENDASTEVVDEIVRLEEVEIVRTIIDPNTKIDVLGKVLELRDMAYKAKMRHLAQQAPDLRLRPEGSSSAFPVDEDSLANLQNDKDGTWFSYIISWLSFQRQCEKPPSPPIRRRQDLKGNSLQEPENLSQEEV
nr:uncharacterized protein LOC117859854 isoform X2 [Setaria viridis]